MQWCGLFASLILRLLGLVVNQGDSTRLPCHPQLLDVLMSNLVDSVHTTAAKSIGEDSKYFLFTMLMALGPQMCDEATKI